MSLISQIWLVPFVWECDFNKDKDLTLETKLNCNISGLVTIKLPSYRTYLVTGEVAV